MTEEREPAHFLDPESFGFEPVEIESRCASPTSEYQDPDQYHSHPEKEDLEDSNDCQNFEQFLDAYLESQMEQDDDGDEVYMNSEAGSENPHQILDPIASNHYQIGQEGCELMQNGDTDYPPASVPYCYEPLQTSLQAPEEEENVECDPENLAQGSQEHSRKVLGDLNDPNYHQNQPYQQPLSSVYLPMEKDGPSSSGTSCYKKDRSANDVYMNCEAGLENANQFFDPNASNHYQIGQEGCDWMQNGDIEYPPASVPYCYEPLQTSLQAPEEEENVECDSENLAQGSHEHSRKVLGDLNDPKDHHNQHYQQPESSVYLPMEKDGPSSSGQIYMNCEARLENAYQFFDPNASNHYQIGQEGCDWMQNGDIEYPPASVPYCYEPLQTSLQAPEEEENVECDSENLAQGSHEHSRKVLGDMNDPNNHQNLPYQQPESPIYLPMERDGPSSSGHIYMNYESGLENANQFFDPNASNHYQIGQVGCDLMQNGGTYYPQASVPYCYGPWYTPFTSGPLQYQYQDPALVPYGYAPLQTSLQAPEEVENVECDSENLAQGSLLQYQYQDQRHEHSRKVLGDLNDQHYHQLQDSVSLPMERNASPNVSQTRRIEENIGAEVLELPLLENDQIITLNLSKRILYELKSKQISRTQFAIRVIGKSSQLLSHLLRHPEHWRNTISSNENWIRMFNWLHLCENDRNAVLNGEPLTCCHFEKPVGTVPEKERKRRIIFTDEQKNALLGYFYNVSQNPEDYQIVYLAKQIGVDNWVSVKNFFRNVRSLEKKKKKIADN